MMTLQQHQPPTNQPPMRGRPRPPFPPPPWQVILFSWFLAGMIGVLCRMGGGLGLAESLAKFAKTRKSTQMVIFIMVGG